jgi:integrase
VEGTRKNYLWALNLYWMPHLAEVPVDRLTPTLLRKTIAAITWTSPGSKHQAIQKLATVLNTVLKEGHLTLNPTTVIDLPRLAKKPIDPFNQQEANRIIDFLYTSLPETSQTFAAYFEFAFFTGMRPCEMMALRWDEVDIEKRVAHVCRIVADRVINERTKTRTFRLVNWNPRAMHALARARDVATARSKRAMAFPNSAYVFPPSKGNDFIRESSVTDKHFKFALHKLGIRDRPQYNCRHTYASLCLMLGQNPSYVAKQLGHSTQILFTRYGTWITGADADQDEIEKLGIGIKVVQEKTTPSETTEIEPLDFHS